MDDDVLTIDKIRKAKLLLEQGVVKYPRYNVLGHPGGVWTPKRPHSKHKNGGKRSYHNRIQKKWNKRFGRIWKEILPRGQCFVSGETVIVRNDEMSSVLEAMGYGP